MHFGLNRNFTGMRIIKWTYNENWDPTFVWNNVDKKCFAMNSILIIFRTIIVFVLIIVNGHRNFRRLLIYWRSKERCQYRYFYAMPLNSCSSFDRLKTSNVKRDNTCTLHWNIWIVHKIICWNITVLLCETVQVIFRCISDHLCNMLATDQRRIAR